MIKAKRISQIKEDILVLAAVWGPSPREEYYAHTVRGVRVEITRQTKLDERNVHYRMCIFPGYRHQWVNEGNIRSRKLSKQLGEFSEPIKQAA